MNLAYIAGLFDGEGCVNFTRCRSSVYPRVMVVNTNRGILEQLQARFGGDIQAQTGCYGRDKWKQAWQWRLQWSKAVEFLDKIQPYLILKAQHAVVVFAWNAIRPTSGKGKSWDGEALSLLTDQLSWLNAKGGATGPSPVDIALRDMYEQEQECREVAIAMSKAGKSRKGK